MHANTDVCNHPCSAVSRILKAKNLLQILTKSSRLLWLPTSSQRQLGGQLFSSNNCDDNDYFLYMLLQLFAMHKARLQAPSDYISDVFDSLDPSPQHHSCSFRFKWLELIVPWGSSVIYRPGTLLLLLNPPETNLLCKFWAKNDHLWGIVRWKWRKKCISGQFEVK